MILNVVNLEARATDPKKGRTAECTPSHSTSFESPDPDLLFRESPYELLFSFTSSRSFESLTQNSDLIIDVTSNHPTRKSIISKTLYQTLFNASHIRSFSDLKEVTTLPTVCGRKPWLLSMRNIRVEEIGDMIIVRIFVPSRGNGMKTTVLRRRRDVKVGGISTHG